MNTRERIQTGAFELFKKRGFKSVTMDEIAKSLQMSKRTIYENFEDKHELIHTIIEIEIKKSVCQFENIMKNNDNVYVALQQIDNIHKESFKNSSPLLQTDLKKYYSAILDNVAKLFFEARNKAINITLAQGIKQGVFLESININAIALMFEDIMDFSIRKIEEKKFTDKDMIDCFVVLLRGISTEKGLEYMSCKKNNQQNKI